MAIEHLFRLNELPLKIEINLIPIDHSLGSRGVEKFAGTARHLLQSLICGLQPRLVCVAVARNTTKSNNVSEAGDDDDTQSVARLHFHPPDSQETNNARNMSAARRDQLAIASLGAGNEGAALRSGAS